MKTTINGFPINKNGKVINQLKGETIKPTYLGISFKEQGTYLFFKRKQGNNFVYSE